MDKNKAKRRKIMIRKWKCDNCGNINNYLSEGMDRDCENCEEGTYYLTDDSYILFSDLPINEQ